jgi:archaellum component FlaG (FlaF/FlaG flagellin family)
MNRKGVTPVVATALLLGISISAVASASVFMGNVLEETGSQFEDDLREQERRDQSTFAIEYGYNSSGGFTFIDVRNTGQVTLAVEEENQKIWTLYVDGKPHDWKYVNDDLSNQANVNVDPREVMRINTTVEYPSQGNSVELEVQGAYETSSAIVCTNIGEPSC